MAKDVWHEHANVLLGDRVFHGTLIRMGDTWVLDTTREIARTPVYDFAERIHLRMFQAAESGRTLVSSERDSGAYNPQGWTFAEAEMQEG